MPEQRYSLEDIVGILTATLAELEARGTRASELAELSMRQVHYLDIIAGLEQPTASELARELGVTKPSVTAIVNKLVQKGFVKKVQSGDDKRAYFLLLTAKGEEIGRRHRDLHRYIARQFTSRLSAAELRQLVGLLGKVVKGLEPQEE
jgi:DNA-binding MarR family transcriptional regulator